MEIVRAITQSQFERMYGLVCDTTDVEYFLESGVILKNCDKVNDYYTKNETFYEPLYIEYVDYDVGEKKSEFLGFEIL